MSQFDKSITINTDNQNDNKYIFINLEQSTKPINILSLNLNQTDIYANTNADWGVLCGRVLSNNLIPVQNAKISIFIPLSTEDSSNPEITSIYPFTKVTDKDSNGKQYNLLPRVSLFNQLTSTFQPNQAFGTFPIKPEIVTNSTLLYVYKTYYKYTTVTNATGDYLIYGVPIGNQTVHLSCDITDIGRTYSMTPQSMVTNLGYSTNLFTNNLATIKPQIDLNDLPQIQLINTSVNIIPFWGDSSNFEIGITRQDFKIRASISTSFTIFGTSIIMGRYGAIGDPDASSNPAATDDGFYKTSHAAGVTTSWNSLDIRTYQNASPIIRLFSYSPSVPISTITGSTTDLNFDTDIYEVSPSTYFSYFNGTGDFVLQVPCNRNKISYDIYGNQIPVEDNSPNGVFQNFYGMMLMSYPNMTFDGSFNNRFAHSDTPLSAVGILKFPTSTDLQYEGNYKGGGIVTNSDNNPWRKEYFAFEAGKYYSIAQFLPTRALGDYDSIDYNSGDGLVKLPGAINNLGLFNGSSYRVGGTDINMGGAYMVVGGYSQTIQTDLDNQNYIITASGVTSGSTFQYDFPYNWTGNFTTQYSQVIPNFMFGAQWINLCAIFPRYIFAQSSAASNRSYDVADMMFANFLTNPNDSSLDVYDNGGWFTLPSTMNPTQTNNQQIFGGVYGSVGIISGKAWSTNFIEIPSTEIFKLYTLPTYNSPNIKGINVQLINEIIPINLDSSPYMYRPPTGTTSDYRGYNATSYDINYNGLKNGYLFRGNYGNDCIAELYNLNLL